MIIYPALFHWKISLVRDGFITGFSPLARVRILAEALCEYANHGWVAILVLLLLASLYFFGIGVEPLDRRNFRRLLWSPILFLVVSLGFSSRMPYGQSEIRGSLS